MRKGRFGLIFELVNGLYVVWGYTKIIDQYQKCHGHPRPTKTNYKNNNKNSYVLHMAICCWPRAHMMATHQPDDHVPTHTHQHTRTNTMTKKKSAVRALRHHRCLLRSRVWCWRGDLGTIKRIGNGLLNIYLLNLFIFVKLYRRKHICGCMCRNHYRKFDFGNFLL